MATALAAEAKARGKGKAEAKIKAPPKPKAVTLVAADPWALGTPAVKKDWTGMKAPPLAMFSCAHVFRFVDR